MTFEGTLMICILRHKMDRIFLHVTAFRNSIVFQHILQLLNEAWSMANDSLPNAW